MNFLICLSFWVADNSLHAAIRINESIHNFQNTFSPPATQATALVPFLKTCLGEVGNPPLTTIIAPRGPGSFTSLRVTLATAQGLSIAFPNAQCFAPSHFEVMGFYGRQKFGPEVPFLLLIDSKRNNYFGQLWNPAPEVPEFLDPDQVEGLQKKIPRLQVIYDHDFLNFYAEAQIHLLDATPSPTAEQKIFAPYYFYTPAYVKKPNIA